MPTIHTNSLSLGALAMLLACSVAAQTDNGSLMQRRNAADQAIWANEKLAQDYERGFVQFWDDLRGADDKLAVFERFDLRQLSIALPGDWQALAAGVQKATMDRGRHQVDRDGYLKRIAELRNGGYRVVQTEWHHASFHPPDRQPARSTFKVSIDAVGPNDTRYQLRGAIHVTWSDKRDSLGHYTADTIETDDLTILRRSAKPIFESSVIQHMAMPYDFEDIIAWDATGDGLSDILFPAGNDLLVNVGGGKFERKALCDHPMINVLEAVMADMTGDGVADLVVVASPKARVAPSVYLHPGDADGSFTEQPRRLAPDNVSFQAPCGMAVGDIDGDGDLDLYVPQYKMPYVRGQFPTPYYDANDGFPAYLLVNQGDGRLEDATRQAGLAAKRFRRTYRSSFVDLDEDGDLDLLVVSDFAGIDIYHNDGAGRFTDVTSQTVDTASNFGMSHVFDDFNDDGRLDFYVTGMGSTTARRLEHMGLRPKDKQTHTKMRMALGYGNRMYLREDSGRYIEPPYRDTVARSGWAWGCTSLDFNNDGRSDIYVCNGNKSGKSAKDYCTRFWCHDIYDSSSAPDSRQLQIYVAEIKPLNVGDMSWNGFEHNRLFMNRGDQGFVDVGFLAGAALEDDCRAVISDDFDNDGRRDLLLVALPGAASPDRHKRNKLMLYMNRIENNNNWIGVRLDGPVFGARVTASLEDGQRTAVYVAGDSHAAQHAPVKHFGLGQRRSVRAIEVRWANGKRTRIDNPAINRYHKAVAK